MVDSRTPAPFTARNTNCTSRLYLDLEIDSKTPVKTQQTFVFRVFRSCLPIGKTKIHAIDMKKICAIINPECSPCRKYVCGTVAFAPEVMVGLAMDGSTIFMFESSS